MTLNTMGIGTGRRPRSRCSDFGAVHRTHILPIRSVVTTAISRRATCVSMRVLPAFWIRSGDGPLPAVIQILDPSGQPRQQRGLVAGDVLVHGDSSDHVTVCGDAVPAVQS